MRQCRLITGLLFAGLIANLPGIAAAQYADQAQDLVKAAMIYNFAKLVTWPKDQLAGGQEFRIGVIGARSGVKKMLDELSTRKKVRGHKIVIKTFERVLNIEPVHILYVGELFDGNVSRLTGFLKGQNTLVVGSLPGFISQGGMIEFATGGGIVQFSLNLRRAEASGLKVSSGLVRLAK